MKRKQSEKDVNLIRAFEVFMAVSDSRHVTAAAASLGMTQSAVSQQLKKLEWALHAPLFNRTQRPIELTHSGDVLRRRALRILNEVEELRAELRHIQSSSIPILRIALLASVATTLTPGLLDVVRKDMKIPELSLSAGISTDHQIALNARNVDIAITSDPQFDVTDYDCIPIIEEPFYLVLPKSYDGPADDIVEVSKRLSLVRFGSDAPVGRRTDQHLQRCRLDLPRLMEADRASMVVAGVATGKCFAILTPTLLIDAVAEGMNLRIEPLPFAGFKRSVVAISRTGQLDDIPASIAKESGHLLRQSFERLMPDVADDIIYFV
ncbi:LysR family transcriptional regulator [Pseudohalocynthiibacter aestuariivivens]|uniref:LysR family transcriptional regulator n=1 Tax=Roseovarius pelagicus TaxID=2980108 RepID=A0ABY6D8U5_9RHOB|nr:MULTISPECIES: LysR family transcriptional regulator [Rhodobacterales]QIE45530.1 LysR family transcriptional regulator [Pseudohalocynthiibacter aestuariivivens]UXX82551.1 LysR family transcriptional regulator [Roseovarius pelagicus]